MAAQNITLKRVIDNSGATDNLFPTTHMGQIQVSDSDTQSLADFLEFTYVPIADLGANSGVATLNSSGKLNAAQVPDYLFGGLKFVSTLTSTQVDSEAKTALLLDGIQQLYGSAALDGMEGTYWVASENITLDAASAALQAGATGRYYDWQGIVPDEEGAISGDTIGLEFEAGDWLVITKVTGSGTNVDPYVIVFGVVNNTYQDGNTTVKGIVKLTNATNTGAYDASTNANGLVNGANEVITENFLFDNILHGELNSASGANQDALKLAASDHIHDGRYYTETEINNWIGGTSTINSAYFTEIKYGAAPSSTVVGTLLIDID
jgi:hypothetical protein